MAFVLIDPHAEKPAVLGLMSIFADPEGARAEYAGAVRSDLKGSDDPLHHGAQPNRLSRRRTGQRQRPNRTPSNRPITNEIPRLVSGRSSISLATVVRARSASAPARSTVLRTFSAATEPAPDARSPAVPT